MLSERPVISVITVCYNSRPTIERAIRSVLDQQWPEIEHIVIDGGSTDGTREILERFRPDLAALVSEPDKGIYDAMNKGLARARGEVVCFLNADDRYADPEVLSDVVRQMQMHRLDALVADVGFFRAEDPGRMIRRYRSDRFSPKKLAWGWMPAHPGFFLRREVAQRVGMFKTDYRIAGDYEFVCGLSMDIICVTDTCRECWYTCRPAVPATRAGARGFCSTRRSCARAVKTA